MALKLCAVNRQFSIRGFYSAFPVKWDETFEFSGESHNFWEIVFFEQGDVECVEDEKVYLVRDNCMLLHAPMEFHRIRSTPGSSPKGFIMTFKTEGVLPEELKKGVFQLHNDEKEEYRSICENIRRLSNPKKEEPYTCGDDSATWINNADREDPYAAQLAADRLSAFLIRLSKHRADRELVSSGSAESYRRVISDMTERVCENLTLADFAKRQNISVSYLKLLFQEYAGLSPKTYYNQLRVNKALQLLEQDLPLAEIAETMNFSSQNYFTVFFRKHLGRSPSEYRKKMKSN